MSDRIMDFNQLSVGRSYRVITNAGYFDKICVFNGYSSGDFARFADESGKKHLIHILDHESANPVTVYEIK